MPREASLLADVVALGESLIEAFLNTRGSLKDELRDRAEIFATKFDLVRREDMEAALLLLSKARQANDSLQHRIDSLESKIDALAGKKPTAKAKKAPLKKKNTRPKTLLSVKQGNRRKGR